MSDDMCMGCIGQGWVVIVSADEIHDSLGEILASSKTREERCRRCGGSGRKRQRPTPVDSGDQETILIIED